jgi:hypothetical protein
MLLTMPSPPATRIVSTPSRTARSGLAAAVGDVVAELVGHVGIAPAPVFFDEVPERIERGCLCWRKYSPTAVGRSNSWAKAVPAMSRPNIHRRTFI